MMVAAARPKLPRLGTEPVALIWEEIDGSVSHIHPCLGELVAEIRECPSSVRTGCTTTVAVWHCASHGSIISIRNGDATAHVCTVGPRP
jgi:hypothetical protein